MAVRKPHRAPAWVLIALACAAAACEVHEDREPAPVGLLSAEAMSALVPAVVDLRVADTAFARMSDNPALDIEVPVAVTIYRGGEVVVAAEPAEIQIKGGSSVFLPAKPLGVTFARDLVDEGAGVLRVPALDSGHTLARVRALRLRGGGNDFKTTIVKDLAFARMVVDGDLRVYALYGEQGATYVNGRFYSLTNLRSENNVDGVSRLFGVDADRVALAAVDQPEDPLEVRAGREGFWRALEAAVAAGDRAAVLSTVDPRGFADFLIAGSVFATQDWPWRNVRLFAVDEGPIQFVLYDFDFSGESYAWRSPLAYFERSRPSLIRSMALLCYGDPAFRALLERRYREVLASGQLAPARLRAELETLAAVYDPVIGYQIARYGFPTSAAAWYVELEGTVDDYARRYRGLPEEFR